MSSVASATVVALSTTPVKGLRIRRPQRIDVQRDGARGDRAFFLVDESGEMVNAINHGELQEVVAEVSDGLLSLQMRDGTRVVGPVGEVGAPMDARFYSARVRVVPVLGPFSSALSEHADMPLRLVRREDGRAAVDRGAQGAVTLISRASVAAVARAAGHHSVDERRFRMTIELDGVEEFAEDAWIGAELSVGEALLRPLGHVGRCRITTRDPDTGAVDLPTLDLLRTLRAGARTTEPLALGVHCEVLHTGAVAVGDGVRVTAAAGARGAALAEEVG